MTTKKIINCLYQMLWEDDEKKLPICKYQPDRWCWRVELGCELEEQTEENNQEDFYDEWRREQEE